MPSSVQTLIELTPSTSPVRTAVEERPPRAEPGGLGLARRQQLRRHALVHERQRPIGAGALDAAGGIRDHELVHAEPRPEPGREARELLGRIGVAEPEEERRRRA